MTWQKELKQFEANKDWDVAIEFMEKIIGENPNNLDTYLSINYLLMNLLVEEDHDENKHHYYEDLLKKYFKESYAKFSYNPEYLYYIGTIACMSEWYFDITLEEATKMSNEARLLDPKNPVYQWDYYYSLEMQNLGDKKEIIEYAKLILAENSPIKKILQTKGALGEYILRIMTNWSKKIIERTG